MDPITIGTAIGTTLLTNFATKGESAPLQTLNDLWYLTFGKLNLLVEKKRANHAALLESYKNELVTEVSAIPDENLIEPPLSIVGPALEASKFYIEEEELRKMFAKVVASSMDDRKASKSHQAFIEIIKQLSPFDARNLALFKLTKRYPAVSYGVERDMNDRLILVSDVFLSTNESNDVEAIRSSMTNLQRLGLLTFKYELSFRDDGDYDIFRNHPIFNNLVPTYVRVEQFPNAKPIIKKGIVELSPFGSDFIDVCL